MSTGADILTAARPHVGEKYVFGAFAPKDNANWSGPWDCAEFASWCLYQGAHILYGCADDRADPADPIKGNAYTGFWARDADALGRKIPVAEAAATPGATVLRVPLPGLVGHIVISDGRGGTVEAHSTKEGVIRGKLAGRNWDMGILVPGVQYARAPNDVTVRPPKIVYRWTTPPMESEGIKRVQLALQKRGFDPGEPDSVFGKRTYAAVRAFQLTKGLLADGEVGSATAAALRVTLS